MSTNDSRTVNSVKNITMALLNNVIMQLMIFITRSVFIKYLGVEYLGINGLFTNVLSFLSMADLGFSTAMNYSFYKPLAENDEKKIAALITFYKKIYNIIALSIGIIGVSLVPFLKYIINMEKDIPNVEIYYLVYLASTVISYLFVYKVSILNASQKNYIVNKYAAVIGVVKSIIQIIVILLFRSFLLYILLNALEAFVNNLLVSRKADNLYPYIKNKVALEKDEKTEIYNNMKSVFVYKVASNLFTGTDSIVISTIVGTIFVGYYANYLTLENVVHRFIIIFFTSVTASLGSVMAQQNDKFTYKIFSTFCMLSYWFSGFATISFYVLADDFITIWIGKQFILDNIVVVAVALNLFFKVSMQPVFMCREAAGLYRKTKFVMLYGAILNLILSIGLGYAMGLAGVVFATVLSRVFSYFIYEPKILYRDYFHEKVHTFFVKYFINLLLVIILAFLLKYALSFITDVSILMWLIKAIICFVFVNLFYFAVYHKTEEFKFVLSKVKFLSKWGRGIKND